MRGSQNKLTLDGVPKPSSWIRSEPSAGQILSAHKSCSERARENRSCRRTTTNDLRCHKPPSHMLLARREGGAGTKMLAEPEAGPLVTGWVTSGPGSLWAASPN